MAESKTPKQRHLGLWWMEVIVFLSDHNNGRRKGRWWLLYDSTLKQVSKMPANTFHILWMNWSCLMLKGNFIMRLHLMLDVACATEVQVKERKNLRHNTELLCDSLLPFARQGWVIKVWIQAWHLSFNRWFYTVLWKNAVATPTLTLTPRGGTETILLLCVSDHINNFDKQSTAGEHTLAKPSRITLACMNEGYGPGEHSHHANTSLFVLLTA